MDTTPIWEVLSKITIGQLVAFGIVAITIITAIIKAIKYVYEFISKYKEQRETNENQTKILKEHEEMFRKINENLEKITNALGKQEEINFKYLRHLLVDMCYEAINKGEISIEKSASLEEMYKEYVVVFNGNSYVSNLIDRVRELPITKITEADKEKMHSEL